MVTLATRQALEEKAQLREPGRSAGLGQRSRNRSFGSGP